MKRFLIYLGLFAVTTLAMALLLFGMSEDNLPWRDALIIGAVFGALVPFAVWRWQEDRKANRRMWNLVRLAVGLGRR